MTIIIWFFHKFVMRTLILEVFLILFQFATFPGQCSIHNVHFLLKLRDFCDQIREVHLVLEHMGVGGRGIA